MDSAILSNWLEIFRSGGDPEIKATVGNLLLTAETGTSGAGGKNVVITGGSADQMNYSNTAGGNVNIVGGLGATDDGGGGGPGGSVNITSGLSADPAGHAGNINITAGSNSWVFDYNGNITLPGNIQGAASYNQPNLLQVNKDDAEWAYGSYASGSDFWMQTKFYGQNQATRGVRFLEAEGSTVVFSVNGLGNAVASGNINAAGSTITGNISSGNIAVTGNISGNTAGYAIGYRDIPQVSFTGNATIATTDAEIGRAHV